MSGLIVDETHLLADLRRATFTGVRSNNLRPTTNDQICSMHDLPYLDGKRGCERCLDLFTPQANATSWKRGQSINHKDAWTHEERAMLRDPRMSDAQISRVTGRTIGAIYAQRKAMRRQIRVGGQK